MLEPFLFIDLKPKIEIKTKDICPTQYELFEKSHEQYVLDEKEKMEAFRKLIDMMQLESLKELNQ